MWMAHGDQIQPHESVCTGVRNEEPTSPSSCETQWLGTLELGRWAGRPCDHSPQCPFPHFRGISYRPSAALHASGWTGVPFVLDKILNGASQTPPPLHPSANPASPIKTYLLSYLSFLTSGANKKVSGVGVSCGLNTPPLLLDLNPIQS